MEPLTRDEMAAIIDGGQPLVFNGVLYTDSDDLPTQEEIDELYAGAGQGIQGPQGPAGADGQDGADGANGADGLDGIVQSVNGISEADIELDADDIDDSTTTNKFVTSANKTNWNAKLDASALDNLDADNLTSGTIPDARFPATLPALDGSNLINLPAGGASPVFVQTATSTLDNSTTETTAFGTGIGSLTIPANGLTVGKTYQIKLQGFVSGQNSFTVRLRLGGTQVGGNALINVESYQNQAIDIDCFITCRSTGGTGTVSGSGMVISTSSNAVSASPVGSVGGVFQTAPTVVDTTGTLAINVTIQMGAASVNDKWFINNAYVMPLN